MITSEFNIIEHIIKENSYLPILSRQFWNDFRVNVPKRLHRIIHGKFGYAVHYKTSMGKNRKITIIRRSYDYK